MARQAFLGVLVSPLSRLFVRGARGRATNPANSRERRLLNNSARPVAVSYGSTAVDCLGRVWSARAQTKRTARKFSKIPALKVRHAADSEEFELGYAAC